MPHEYSPANSKSFIKIASERILSALIRTVVNFGVTYPELIERIKLAYVKEVEQDLVSQDEKVTLSRISVISGVHRKDVKRLLSTELSDSDTERSSLTARLISLWVGDSRYIDRSGQPKLLPAHGDISFESLVLSISTDIRSRTVLDDLIRRGIVIVCDDKLKLNQEALFPSDDLETKIEFLARNISDHILTCHHNIQRTEDSLPERSVFYDRLSKDSVDLLQQLASEKITELVLEINQLAQKRAEIDDLESGNLHRFILGSYFYREQEEAKHDS